MIELLLGQIPDAIYLALFIIFAKRIKEKRLLFVFLIIFEFLFLKVFIKFNIWFHVLYTFMVFLILKVLYKEKAQITDIFTLIVSTITMMIISIPLYIIINLTIHDLMIYAILDRILLFVFLLISHNKLYNIQKIYKIFWNRNDKKKIMKTTTFRAINIVAFNIVFYIINAIILYILCTKGGN